LAPEAGNPPCPVGLAVARPHQKMDSLLHRFFLILLLARHAAGDGTCDSSGENPLACSPQDSDALDARVELLQSTFKLKDTESASGESSSRESGALNQSSAVNQSSAAELQGQQQVVQTALQASTASDDGSSDSPHGVNVAGCPCIGVSGRNGTVFALIDGQNVPYPINTGSYCNRWDDHTSTKCMGSNAPDLDGAWCLEKWCFVDPCNCKLSGAVPHLSTYFQNDPIQNKKLYYSYEACGEIDVFTQLQNNDACTNKKTSTDCFKMSQCSWSLNNGGSCLGKELTGSECSTSHLSNALVWGKSECACIGVNWTAGSTEAELALNFSNPSSNATQLVSYPAGIGATCKAWDQDVHPECKGPGSKPDFCKQKWCFVDPCKCGLKSPPALSTYFPDALWKGHPLYYSYVSCGSRDTYTATNNLDACVNQKDQTSCESQGNKCGWTVLDSKYQCVGYDLATLCTPGFTQESGAGRAALFLGIVPLLVAMGLSLL